MAVTNYIWDGENCLLETDGNDDVQTVYTYEPETYGNLISSRVSGTTYYHHYDALGSTRQLSNAAGTVSDTWVYDAWGNTISRTGATAIFLQWIGQIGYYFDSELGMAWVRARPLSPVNARWTTVDPAEFVDGSNRYRYVNNRAIGLVDPSGKAPKFVDQEDLSCGGGQNGEQDCVKKAYEFARKTISDKAGQCFGVILCPGGKKSSCDFAELAACILDAMDKVEFACADRGKGGCHQMEKNSGHTETVCGSSKSLASLGVTFPVPGFPSIPPLGVCDPCKSLWTFGNDCASCPSEFLTGGTTSICRDNAPDNKSIASYCTNEGGLRELAALLVHEASHNCVGGHMTTGGAGGCDQCGRPDSNSVESEFKKCMNL